MADLEAGAEEPIWPSLCSSSTGTTAAAAVSASRWAAGLSSIPFDLPIQPQRGGAPTVVEGGVGRIVLHVGLPGAGDHVGAGVHIVLLRCYIPLNVENELLPRLQVSRTPLCLQHGRERGVIDMAAVARLVRRIHAVEHGIR